ncbi:hypothetical protein RCC89_21015 [Cytophagaceae bacterium ABcell3]|nr:hypothetical protein RCC89_21015 [Cytophagaceae bacterium ABcell3]
MDLKNNSAQISLHILLALVILFTFYSKVILNLNSSYFGITGDGIQAYYATLYHLNYDDTYFQFNGMNYPYGENIFFTSGLTPISLIVKYLDPYFPFLKNYTLGIINFLTIFSLLVCAPIIFLILRRFNIPLVFSHLAAIGIAFASPQIPRFGGHYTLSYVFAIPLIIYLLTKFYDRPTKTISILVCISVTILGFFHLYYFGILGSIILLFLLFAFISKKISLQSSLLNAAIMLALPFISIKLAMYFTDPITDRTMNPWGLFTYVSNPLSVFFPVSKPHDSYLLFPKYINLPYLQFEGIAFIGMNALIVVLIAVVFLVKRLIRKEFSKILPITDNGLINLLFWIGIVTLIFSFGWILSLSMPLFDLVPFLKQLRGVGRFSWIFFYIINLVAFYTIYKYSTSLSTKKRYALYTAVFFLLGYDAYIANRNHGEILNKSIPELVDTKNQTINNIWLNKIDISRYQAIIPFPYFHVGSESIWIQKPSNIFKYTSIYSLKTGLPTTGVHMSRTSLSQTYKNVAAYIEPYKPLEVVKDFKSKKPFLVLAIEEELEPTEKTIIDKSKLIHKGPEFSVYELPFSTLENLHNENKQKVFNEYNSLEKHLLTNGFESNNPQCNMINLTFDEGAGNKVLRGNGSLLVDITQETTLYDGPAPSQKEITPYVLNFWVGDFTKDVYARGRYVIDLKDNDGNIIKRHEDQYFRKLTTLDNDWALIEVDFDLDENCSHIAVKVKNNEMVKGMIHFDEMLIRPANADVYKYDQDKGLLYKNNRVYVQKPQ